MCCCWAWHSATSASPGYLACYHHYPTLMVDTFTSSDRPIMRYLTVLLWASVAFQTNAVSPEALIYTFPDSSRDKSRTPTISPNDARLLFAQRLGLSEYHSLGDVDQDTLELLNVHRGQQRSIFDDASKDSPRQLLVVIEGVKRPEGRIHNGHTIWHEC